MPSEEEQIIQMIAQELMSGKSVDEVANELVQAGVPRNDAYEIVNAVAQELGPRAPARTSPPRRKRGHPWITLLLIVIIVFLLLLLMKNR